MGLHLPWQHPLLREFCIACRDEPIESVAQVTNRQGLYPVSMEWDPPFTMMVDLIGHGDLQVSASLGLHHMCLGFTGS